MKAAISKKDRILIGLKDGLWEAQECPFTSFENHCGLWCPHLDVARQLRTITNKDGEAVCVSTGSVFIRCTGTERSIALATDEEMETLDEGSL